MDIDAYYCIIVIGGLVLAVVLAVISLWSLFITVPLFFMICGGLADGNFLDDFLLSRFPLDEQVRIINKRFEDVSKEIDETNRRTPSFNQADVEKMKELRRRKDLLEVRKKLLEEKKKALEDNVFEQEYVNEDMKRIMEILGCIPPKIVELSGFNSQLGSAISEYKGKANKIIEEAYKKVLNNSSIIETDYFENYEKISQQYSLKINPHLAMACDSSVKKIVSLITQKQDIISKNNADIDKYKLMRQKLQQQYDDELALQKIKMLNKDINSEMEDVSDIANKEIKNSEIQSIISEIDLLDKEVNERRNYEIQFGQIEV